MSEFGYPINTYSNGHNGNEAHHDRTYYGHGALGSKIEWKKDKHPHGLGTTGKSPWTYPGKDNQSPGSKRHNDWLVSYLDVFTLLLAFFLVVSAATTDSSVPFFQQASNASSEPFTDGQEQITTPIWDVMQDLETILDADVRAGRLRLEPQYDEIRLIFTDGQFFNSGSAMLLNDGRTIVNQITTVLASMSQYEFYIDVEGHTDDRPIQTLHFPSNWELSTARASGVIRYFKEQGFPAERLKASGYADIHPTLPNRDDRGNPILENMDQNRRIVIRIYYELGEIL